VSPQKPTGRNPKRVGLPKSPGLEPSHQQIEPAARHELPTDFQSLALILEAAMKPQTRSPNAQIPKPQAQTPNPDVEEDFDSADEILQPELETDIPIPHRRRTDEVVVPSPRPAAGSNETTQNEAAAFDEVARSLGAAEACVPLLAQSTGLLRIAALDVVKAETARAGGLLQLLRFLRGDLTPATTAVSTSAVLLRIAQAVESERRLRGVALTTRSSVGDATCAGDETLLVNTLLALLLTTFAAIEGVQNARVMLSITVSDSGEIGLAVSQDHVPAPPAWLARAGSDELTADTGQALPAIALSAAHRLVWHWGGRFAIATGEHSSILTLWLPTLQPEDLDPLPH
jgi:hypothetical protein